jgi:hypothetical protein
MPRNTRQSFRGRLGAFQAMRGTAADPAFLADLAFLQNRDLDLSVRLGALLAFDALMITIGTHPVSASPGAPLSLDAPSQPLAVVASLAGIVPFILSGILCLRAMLTGEDFDAEGRTVADVDALRHRLFAAFIASIDAQSRNLVRAVHLALAGGVLTGAVWAWIIMAKAV